MAGARILLDVRWGGTREALQRLTAFGDAGLELALADMGEYLMRSIRERAAREVDPQGVPWTPLSPRYKRFKDAKRPGKKKLTFDNHMLFDQFSYQVQSRQLLVGTAAKYGATHQFGRGKIPARPYLGISTEDETELVAILGDHLARAVGGGGSTPA